MKRMALSRRRIEITENRLQHILNVLPLKRDRKRVEDAMSVLNAIAMKMRRQAIFDAGRRSKTSIPKFEGRTLGSMESMNFYDGYASTHPGFKNPYRSGSWDRSNG